jgi:Ni/Co efflux regulator RcnB
MKKILGAFVALAFVSATPAFAAEEKKEEKKAEKTEKKADSKDAAKKTEKKDEPAKK